MIGAYLYQTREGAFVIRLHKGRWHVLFEGENLGSYFTPQQAAEELADGSTEWPGILDPTTLEIPDDIGEWEPVSSHWAK